MVKTRVTVWHETDLRRNSLSNSKMMYLNLQVNGLSGAGHPAIRGINTTQEAKKLRPHLKFLTSDIMTNERRALDQPHLSSAYDLCGSSIESIEHVLTICSVTQETRDRLLYDLLSTVSTVQPSCSILLPHLDSSLLTQFILDCTSLNLPDSIRIPAHHPGISEIYKISREWTYAINRERSRLRKSSVK